MAKEVHKYRMFCNDCNDYVFAWSDIEITTCPASGSHTIDADSITIVDTVGQEVRYDDKGNLKVKIKEENTETGGRYQIQTFTLDVGAVIGQYTKEISFPMDVGLLNGLIEGNSDIAGDEAEMIVVDDVLIGATIASITIGENEIEVQQSVIDNVQIGYWVSIDGDNFGIVTNVNEDDSKITVEIPATKDYTPGMLIRLTVKMVPKIVFFNSGILSLGSSKIGASHLSAGTTIKIKYNRKVAGVAHKFNITFEYLY